MIWVLAAALATGMSVLIWRAMPLARLAARASPAAARTPPGMRRRVGTAALIAASALLLGGGLGWWALLVAGVLGVVSHLLLGRLSTGWQARRRRELAGQLPQLCDLLAVGLEAGLPLRRAVEVLAAVLPGPVAGLLALIDAQVRLGVDEARVWAEIAEEEPALGPLGREVARTVESGVALAATLRALGAEVRREALAAAEVRAKRVGVRTVLPLMICFLPAFLLLGVLPIIGGLVQSLFGSP